MSYTNETTYYGIPLPTGSDKSTWTDDNTAKERIDADLHSAVEMSTAASEDIVAIKATVANLSAADIQFQSDLDTVNGKIDALQDKETLQDGQIAAVRADAEDMITAYNEPTATSTHAYTTGDYFIYNDVLYQATSSIAVGDTIVPDSNCTTTNVAVELSQINSELSSKLDWTVSSPVTGNATIDLPTGQHDLLFRITTPNAHQMTIFLPAAVRGFTLDTYAETGSYQNENFNSKAQLKIDGTVKTVRLNAVYENGTEVTGTSTLVMYYR